jgi:VWFA-related protein
MLVSMMLPTMAWLQGAVQVKLGEVKVDESFPALQFPLTILNANGVPVLDLEKDNFELAEDGVPLTIQSVQTTKNRDLSIAVALVLDLSSSAPIEDVKRAAYQFLDYLGPNDRVALIGFNDNLVFDDMNPEKEIGFTSDLDAVRAVVDGLTKAGWSAVYEAIYKGVLITGDEVADRRAVIVMTDGFDNRSRPAIASADKPVDKAKELGIPVFTVGIYNPDPSMGKDPDYLNVLAREAGGRYQKADDPAQLSELFQSVVDQLRTEYLVTARTNQERDGKDHMMKIRVQTSLGDGVVERAVAYPSPPIVPEVLELQREVNGELQPVEDGEEIKGRVLFVPKISAENPIVLVEYRLDGTLLESVAVESDAGQFKPWELNWSTCNIQEGMHMFEITAHDNAGTVSQPFVTEVYALRPAPVEWLIACVPETVGLDLWVIIAIAAALLFFGLVVFFMTRRRAPEPSYEPLQPPPPGPSEGPSTLVSSPPQATPSMSPSSPSATQPQMSPGIPPTQPASGYQASPEPAMSPSGREDRGGRSPAPPPRTMVLKQKPKAMGWLIVEKGVHAGKEFRLGEVASIGRTGDNDIVLDDPAVSRQHAKIRLEGSTFTVFDLGATNTTKVNEQEIGKHQLVDGDRIEIGQTVLVFKQVKTS